MAADAALEGRFEDLHEISDAICEVRKQPTAYDLDGVIERLKERGTAAAHSFLREPKAREDIREFNAGRTAATVKAIEIVKGGVNHENA